MASLRIHSLTGTDALLETAAVEPLRKRLRGHLVLPTDGGYDEARRVWNGMVDKKPAIIVRCAAAGDVVEAVDFARDHGLLVSVRGGGHNVAGSAVCEGGLMIDLSGMKGIRVDPERRTARAEAGLVLGEFDAATQAFGLATTMGVNSDTGISGLTLGGGFGKLGRKHGLACDNLLAADIVTRGWPGRSEQARPRTPICSGASAAAAATSVSSPHSNTGFIPSARRCWPGPWSMTTSRRGMRCGSTTTFPATRRTGSAPMRRS